MDTYRNVAISFGFFLGFFLTLSILSTSNTPITLKAILNIKSIINEEKNINSENPLENLTPINKSSLKNTPNNLPNIPNQDSFNIKSHTGKDNK